MKKRSYESGLSDVVFIVHVSRLNGSRKFVTGS
jgi:hypothetical protein